MTYGSFEEAQELSTEPLVASQENQGVLQAPSVSGITEPLSLADRFKAVVSAAKEDYQDNPSRFKQLVSGVGALAMQGLDRARTSVVLIPTLAANVLEHTHSPVQTALVAGVAFTGWCVAVGGATTEGLTNYPKATAQVGKSFPGVADFFEESLPGVNTSTQEHQTRSPVSRIAHRVLTGARRGLTVAGIGNTAYVSTAAVKGRSRADIHKLNLNASLDGGSVVGLVALGLGQTATELAETYPELAQNIQEHASDVRLWYGVAGAMMLGQFISGKIKQFRTKE